MRLADAVSFIALSGGTGSFVVGSARPSFRTPAQAVTAGSLTDGDIVTYLAQDSLSSPTQREWGRGTFTALTNTITRNNVMGTISAGVSGSGTPVNFSVSPTISLTALGDTFNFPSAIGSLSQFSKVANGNITFYVATTGRDDNPGTVGAPFQTPQAAINEALTWNWQGNTWNIQLADGDYVANTPNPDFVLTQNGTEGNNPLVLGNAGSPASVIVGEVLLGGPSPVYNFIEMGGFTIRSSSSIAAIWVLTPGLLIIDFPIRIGTRRGDGHCDAPFYSTAAGGGIAINSAAVTILPELTSVLHLAQAIGGFIEFTGPSITFPASGSISCSLAMLDAEQYGDITWNSTTVVNGGTFGSGQTSGFCLNFSYINYDNTMTLGTGVFFSNDNSCKVNGSMLQRTTASGLPSTSDLNNHCWGVFKDNSGGGVWLALNDNGTIKKVQLT